jgi:hypothetical protein
VIVAILAAGATLGTVLGGYLLLRYRDCRQASIGESGEPFGPPLGSCDCDCECAT